MKRAWYIIPLELVFLMMAAIVLGKEDMITVNLGNVESRLELKFSDEEFILDVRIDTLYLEEAPGTEGWIRVRLPGYREGGAGKTPALPETSILFEAPKGSGNRIRIEALDSLTISLEDYLPGARLLPAGNSARKEEGLVQDRLKDQYGTPDEWLGSPLVQVLFEGRMRGLELSRLQLCPLRYNPARSEIRIYHRLRCIIEAEIPSSLSRDRELFRKIHSRVVMQDRVPAFKALQLDRPMGLVILSDTLFREALRPFVEWKMKKGFMVEELYVQELAAGRDRKAIRDSLRHLYFSAGQENLPSYLLIIGDVEQVPTSQEAGEVSDLYYACFDGEEDYIPDLFYGRISVDSPDQLRAVTEKIMEYEQYAFDDPSFLDRNMLIAGVDGQFASTYGNGQINYAYDLYLNQGRGYDTRMFPYPESGESGRQIRERFSEGLAFVNYTGHGENDRWTNPSFTAGHIPELENKGMYPVVIGNGCRTNDFAVGECFAEALLRAPGRGALAYMGCTNDSYWDEDYYWAVGMGPVRVYPEYGETLPGCFDKTFHTHGEDPEIWTPSLGEMLFGGNMSVQESSSMYKRFYWEIYQLAGDPTLVPWFGQAEVQAAEVPASLPPDSRRLEVRCRPRSYVALSEKGRLLDARHASPEGLASLFLPDSLAGTVLDVVISAEGCIPFQQQIRLSSPGGAYPELLDFEIVYESLEKDSALSPGEELHLDLLLVNRGAEEWTGDSIVLMALSPSAEVVNAWIPAPPLAAGDSLRLEGAFRIRATGELKDGEKARLSLVLDRARTPYLLELEQRSPRLHSLGITWEDRPGGNGNGMPEPGEWINCRWGIANAGSFRTDSLATGSTLVSLRDRILHPGDSLDLGFRLKLDGMEKGREVQYQFSAGDGHVRITDSIRILKNCYMEDFSSGSPDRFPFRNRSTRPWRIDGNSFASPPYSLRSGTIGHDEQSRLELQLELESPDTIAFRFSTSSEEYYDRLTFAVDAVSAGVWSGNHQWEEFRVLLDSGKHLISWTYAKDQRTIGGEDAAWIDDIILPANSLREGDLALVDIGEPLSGPWLGSEERIGVQVINHSRDSSLPVMIAFLTDGEVLEEVSFDGLLGPGESGIYRSEAGTDLSAMGTRLVGTRLLSDTLGFAGNNLLEKEVSHYAFPELALVHEGLQPEDYCFGKLSISVLNEGNVAMAPALLEWWVDQGRAEGYLEVPALEPGAAASLDLVMADSLDPLVPGMHTYHLILLVSDSVAGNNELMGILECGGMWDVEAESRKEWTVFPNPTQGSVQLHMQEAAGPGSRVRLLAMDGRILRSFPLVEGEWIQELDLGGLEAGYYMLRDEKGDWSASLLIVH